VAARLEPLRAVLIEARSFAKGDGSAIDAWLAGHHVGRVVGVLPASSIICRTCNLPNGPQLQLENALRLQAETQLLGSVPTHRLSTAILHESEGEPNRTGLILAWPESSEAPKPPTSLPTTYAPVVASLAALLNGSRPNEPLLFVNRHDGSLALSMTHANGAIFRAARIESPTDDAGLKSILRSVTETALSVGHTGEFIDETNAQIRSQLETAPFADASLILPTSMTSELASRLHGAPASSDWWAKFGIAAGAVLAASDQLAPLTQMLFKKAALKPSRVRELSTLLSDRKVALKLLAACLAIVVFAPVAFSGFRLLILTIRYPNLDEQLKEIETSTHSLAMYKDLKSNAWSMTKVLSDLVSSAPEGIELETIAIDHGKELRIKGTARAHNDASATDAVQFMQSNMQQYQVFKDIRPSWDSPNPQGTSYDFSLVARVNDPHIRPNYPEELDFAAMTLADRRYGKQPEPGANTPATRTTGSTTRPQPGSSQDEQMQSPPRGRPETTPTTGEEAVADGEQTPVDGEAVALNEPRRGGRGALSDHTGTAGDTSTRGDGGGAPIAHRIPEPLSEAQIAAMSEPEVRDAMAKVAEAMGRAPNLDAETRERLRNEFVNLRNRLREVE